MKKYMKSNNFEKYATVFWIFMIGSFFGFIFENVLMFFRGRYALRQGLIYEPLIPVYGCGLLVFYVLFNKIDLENKNKVVRAIIIFLVGFFMGGIVEYLFSFVQEKCFGTISWDYTHFKFNINGRTSLRHMTYWGLLGLIFYETLLPPLKRLKKYMTGTLSWTLTLSLSMILLFDCSISWVASQRWNERLNNIPADSKMDMMLDKYYPDEYLNKIFNNARPANKNKK